MNNKYQVYRSSKKMKLIVVSAIIFFLILCYGINKLYFLKKNNSFNSDNNVFSPVVKYFFSDTEAIKLCCAIYDRNFGVIDEFAEKKYDFNIRGKDDMTPLFLLFQFMHIASIHKTSCILENSNDDILEKKQKKKELFVMYEKEYTQMLETLLIYGSNPNIQIRCVPDDKIHNEFATDFGNGASLTFMAAGYYFTNSGNGTNILPLVLQYGANPNIIYTYYHATPIFAACNPGIYFGQTKVTGKYKGGYISDFSGRHCIASPYNVGLLIDAGAEIEFRDKWRNTPLIAAAGGGNFDIVLMLLEAGADYTAANEDGENLAYFLYLAKHNNPKIDTAESIDPYYNKVVDFLKNKNYSLESAYAELGDQLKRLPEPPKEFNVKASDDGRRPFDPYADEWIQKRKKEQTNNQ